MKLGSEASSDLQALGLTAVQLRENVENDRDTFNMNDPFLVEGPAKGVHIGERVLDLAEMSLLSSNRVRCDKYQWSSNH